MEDQAQKFKALLTVLSAFKKRHPDVQSVITGIHEKGSLAGALRVRVINVLEAHYRAVERPTPFQKLHARVIISLKQGYDGDIAECFYCSTTADVLKGLQNHHEDYQTWNNVLPNLHCAHPACNTTHSNKKSRRPKKSSPSVLNNVNVNDDQARPEPDMQERGNESKWTSTEGERHDKVRVRFDRMLRDVIHGPFAVAPSKRKEDPTYRHVWQLSRLAKFCVNVPELIDKNVKLSSVTFARWIEEDTEGPLAPLWIDTEEKPYKIGLKDKIYREQCKAAGIPESEYSKEEKAE